MSTSYTTGKHKGSSHCILKVKSQKMIDQCVYYFCKFFRFFSTARAFSGVVSLVSLTTFIHPVFSVCQIYSPLQIFKWLPFKNCVRYQQTIWRVSHIFVNFFTFVVHCQVTFRDFTNSLFSQNL